MPYVGRDLEPGELMAQVNRHREVQLEDDARTDEVVETEELAPLHLRRFEDKEVGKKLEPFGEVNDLWEAKDGGGGRKEQTCKRASMGRDNGGSILEHSDGRQRGA
ncbi:hypothetical protein HPP92_029086 [Vanilla planifolia]|uniref:Uncharacterized protein n=1 Tax=Vanilla planifolia TaxID=51239 RepID=A0A835P634_VANPL|nr:hypothetical protein HPP92_029075 [Vanilla planifolia]KAG0445945.1 hypothetical protein HPP92_029086 [Vanilla planifolia]